MNSSSLIALINQTLAKYEWPAQQNTGAMKQVLNKYILRKLRHIICDITQNGKHELTYLYDHVLLRDFLSEFYSIVKDTNAMPLYCPNSGLSIVMIELAKMLEKYFYNISRFELLMPSIQITDFIISATSLHDSELELRGFVMNDDGTCLIEVLNCLKFASEDGILKHTCLFDGKVKELSDSEQKRVIDHSQETMDYWKAIQNKINITLYGDNFGAVLRRLVNDLKNGSAYSRRDGEEYNSGVDANIGIVNFFMWYDAITEEERAYLDRQDSQDHTEGYKIQELLDRLRRPQSANFTDGIFCVDLIASEIQTIIYDNDHLFDTYPENSITETLIIEQALVAVENAERNLVQALENPNYKITPTYETKKSSSVLLGNLSKQPDLADYVSKRTISKILRQTNNIPVRRNTPTLL